MVPVNYNYKMPSVVQLLRMGRKYEKRKEPVWVYLDREMRQGKRYNFKVGIWLRFLKELRYFQHCHMKKLVKIINRECGPPWYCEFTSHQMKILSKLPLTIHTDIIDDCPTRTRNALWDMGITLKIPNSILMKAMLNSGEDPGVFMWNLYTLIYEMSPSVLRKTYDVNSKLFLSSMCFMDLKECLETFEKLLFTPPRPKPKPKPKPRKEPTQHIPFYPYIQDVKVPPGYCPPKKKEFKPRRVNYKFKLRTKKSCDRLMMSTDFLEKRKLRNMKDSDTSRKCDYKFWVAPTPIRKGNNKERDLQDGLAMLKKRAKMATITRTDNSLVNARVTYSQFKPKFQIDSICTIRTDYICINGGCVNFGKETIMMVSGFAKIRPKEEKRHCCDCLSKWETRIMTKLKVNYQCRCEHFYDFFKEGKVQEKMFHPPTRHGPFWFDETEIYKFDFRENFVREQIKIALSESTMTTVSSKNAAVDDMKPKEVVAVLLADLANSPLILPHLPKASMLNNLQEWVRKRISGPLTVEQHRKLLMHSERRWTQLMRMDFRARATFIPFSQTQLENMTWKHKNKMQEMFKIIFEDFATRNRINMLDQSRMWWSTMHYDQYPGKPFSDFFFSLLPSRMQESHFVNPPWTGIVY